MEIRELTPDESGKGLHELTFDAGHVVLSVEWNQEGRSLLEIYSTSRYAGPHLTAADAAKLCRWLLGHDAIRDEFEQQNRMPLSDHSDPEPMDTSELDGAIGSFPEGDLPDVQES